MANKESKAVDTKLTGSENAETALQILVKSYGHSTAVQMLNRGEYDVLYRAGRRELTSEQRKQQKARMDAMERELVKRGVNIAELTASLKAKK